MRDQSAALKYLAEKQFERLERQFWRDLVLCALALPVVMTGVVLIFLYVL